MPCYAFSLRGLVELLILKVSALCDLNFFYFAFNFLFNILEGFGGKERI